MTEKELSADMELLKRGLKMGKYILKQDAISVLVNEVKTHNNPVKRAYTRAGWVNLNFSYPSYMINSGNELLSVTWYTGMYPYYELKLYCRLYNDDRVYKCIKRVSVLPRWVVDRIKDIPYTETKDKWKWVLKDVK